MSRPTLAAVARPSAVAVVDANDVTRSPSSVWLSAPASQAKLPSNVLLLLLVTVPCTAMLRLVCQTA
jgi:hypothetical protein